MIDIHCHILPEVDDGARSWEMAVEMCRIAERDGTTHMVATPHANRVFYYDRAYAESLIAELRRRTNTALTFGIGCDFRLSPQNLGELEKDPGRFTISGTQYLLVELDNEFNPAWVTERLEQLIASGIRPIITHPERNAHLQQHLEQVVDWSAMGCVIQVTANALTGRWGEKAAAVAHWLLRNNVVDVIASDCHNVRGRAPVLSGAFRVVEEGYGADRARALFIDHPLAVIDNRVLARASR